MKTDSSSEIAIDITHIEAEMLRVPIIGTSPLIVHNFSAKAKEAMADAMQGRKTPKKPKDPEAEYEACFYRTKDEGYGFPSGAFKQAIVGAARFYGKAVAMTTLRSSVFTRGEPGQEGTQLFAIEGEPWMREDVVRVGISGHDLRYRPQFDEWRMTLEIVYVKALLTRGSLLSLIDAGGMGIGVGEWRPERRGDNGTRDLEILS